MTRPGADIKESEFLMQAQSKEDRQAPSGWYPDPQGSGKERRWDGSHWTYELRDGELTPQSDAERKTVLAQRIAYFVGLGYRVESQTEFQAVVVTGHRPNHILHLILSIVTAGLWLIVWLIVAIGAGEKRRVISIDEYGQPRLS